MTFRSIPFPAICFLGRALVIRCIPPRQCGVLVLALCGVLGLGTDSRLSAQSLEESLRQQAPRDLITLAKTEGDATRGAILFFQPHMACSKCHSVGNDIPSALGPDLAKLGKEVTDEHLIESVLLPSKVIRKGFESVTLLRNDGTTRSGILVERTADQITIRDLARSGEQVKIPLVEIDEVKMNVLSIMPAAQVNQLTSRQQFLDLIRYLMEIRDGGVARAQGLQPSPALLTYTLPEYEANLDHAGLIRDWNDDSLKRGEAIYRRVCMNCHGTREQPGSLPTSLRFAEGKFKNGSEPWAMYQTLTRGFGLMAAQTWMVPSQKYDVIHYLRETYLKPHNPTQYASIDAAYLARLPRGESRGPEPSKIEPWSAMDYGPTLTHTYEVPGDSLNLAYKGIAIRLDSGAGGISRGRNWTIFDTDTLRVAAVWSASDKAQGADKFIDWRGIQMNGEHQVHPRITGDVAYANANGPGWGNPQTGDFVDDQRTEGRDGRRYGPLPRHWGQFHGLYHHNQEAILSYRIGTTEILESPRFVAREDLPDAPLFLRTFHIGPRDRELVLQVADGPKPDATAEFLADRHGAVVTFPAAAKGVKGAERAGKQPLVFDGQTHLQIRNPQAFEMTTQDLTITARFKTKGGGTLFSLANEGSQWSPNGQTLFIRDGHLGFDIGWVGALVSKGKVNDGQWHTVAATWQKSTGRLSLYIDGRLDQEGNLAAKGKLDKPVARIGFTTTDFPQPESFFRGELDEVRFYQRRLLVDELKVGAVPPAEDKSLVGRWLLGKTEGNVIADTTSHGHDADVRQGKVDSSATPHSLAYGLAAETLPGVWIVKQGRLCLTIPAGPEPLKFSLWAASMPPQVEGVGEANAVAPRLQDRWNPVVPESQRDLLPLTKGGPPRWPQRLETQAVIGADNGPFAVDFLSAPESNPWLAQLRFTGLDFFADGRIALCSWDGDVWVVEMQPPAGSSASKPVSAPQVLRWQRIASGLFQPLGLKIVEGKIHVICRDQLAVLHDLNGDGETDFYECLNNDHQVTEHFHEFAMGLQTDAEGNFYYAKSGRHALPAVVPHHGTLLRVSKDGSQTDILATGFRAANGVCLNPDGSFVVTDQEGFWNPKNRINWVTLNPTGKPKFFGNMFGYHDVTDASDEAMEPPLCWITNAFDRSPAELLWVESDRWGPLRGSLLNLSYGYGKVFLVPHEKVDGLMQGGMIELPIPIFPTGVMRGRFHPADGQLYLCGMFAWAGNASHPGGFYRIRATGQPILLPVGLSARKSGLTLTFTDPLDPASLDLENVHVKTWGLKRSANYGSNHFDEKMLPVQRALLSADGKQLSLEISDIKPTWCMEIEYSFRSRDGKRVTGKIHNTIHRLNP